jgi:membrane associated rhomboid family serine protease
MDSFLQNSNAVFMQFEKELPIAIGFVILLLVIHLFNFILRGNLNLLGIWPRKKFGWIGIPFSPFLHAHFSHFIFNAIPLFIFSSLILLQGEKIFFKVSIIIILISGLLTWLFARKGFVHIGYQERYHTQSSTTAGALVHTSVLLASKRS